MGNQYFEQITGKRKEEAAKMEEEKKFLRDDIKSKLAESIQQIDIFGTRDSVFIDKLRNKIKEIVKAESKTLPVYERTKFVEELIQDITSLGKLHPFIDDPTVSEIMVNAIDEVYIERNGKVELTDVEFRDHDEIRHIIEKIVTAIGRRIDISSPIVDARLPDGSRVHAVIPPIALKGPTLTIRKFAKEKYTIKDLIAFGSLTDESARLLQALVAAKANIIISGGTGTGKTTMLNVLSNFIPDGERIITAEDSAELQIQKQHVIKLETRDANTEGQGQVVIRDLVKATLRMRPDRVIVGEVRDASAFDMLQAMNTGHDGSMTTVHSNSPELAITRLEKLVLMAGMDLPAKFIRQDICDAIEIIVQIKRFHDGSRRVVNITEIVGQDENTETVILNDLYAFEKTGEINGRIQGSLKNTGKKIQRESINEKLAILGLSYEDIIGE